MEQLAHPGALEAITEDATEASAEFGREYFDASVQRVVEMVQIELEQLGR